MDFVFVDLETTGGLTESDRITEIAVVRCRHGQEVGRWSHLLNPQQKLTPFIQQLTGLTDAELAAAPCFAELASTIEAQLSDAIVVAHNARFDYGFLKAEFARMGRHWQATNLCTVKLSRALYPNYRKHGLDQLVERHQLYCEQRHRALGDALATLRFYQHANQELGEQVVAQQVEQLLRRPKLPPQLADDALDALPTTAGWYRLLTAQQQLVATGYGQNLYQRLTCQLQALESQPCYEQIVAIESQQTAGVFSAHLQFWQQLKVEQPLCGKSGSGEYYTFMLSSAADGLLQVQLSSQVAPQQVGQCYGLFRSKSAAEKALQGLAKAYQLSELILRLETGEKLALGSSVQDHSTQEQSKQDHSTQAQAAQAQVVTPCQALSTDALQQHNQSLQQALAGLRLKPWPWPNAIVVYEKDSFTGLSQGHLFHHWCYLGSLEGEPEQFQWQTAAPSDFEWFDKELYHLLNSYLFAEKSQCTIYSLTSSAAGYSIKNE